MDKVKENVKKYYERKSLSEEKVDLLTGRGSKDQSPWSEYRVIWISAVATVLVIGLIFAYQQLTLMDLEGRVFKEIAMNHKKELSVEFETNSLGQLQASLDKLDFDLIKADEFVSSNYELIGGRYCSIQGNLAAQLTVINNESGKSETLYVTTATGELENLKDTSFNYKGTRIKLWKEDGNLYGLAYDN